MSLTRCYEMTVFYIYICSLFFYWIYFTYVYYRTNLFTVLWKQTTAILKFYFRFQLWHISRHWHLILHMHTKFCMNRSLGGLAVTLCRFSSVSCWTRTTNVAKLNVEFWGLLYPLRSPISEKSGMRKWTYKVCCSIQSRFIGAMCRCWWARNPKFPQISPYLQFNIVWLCDLAEQRQNWTRLCYKPSPSNAVVTVSKFALMPIPLR